MSVKVVLTNRTMIPNIPTFITVHGAAAVFSSDCCRRYLVVVEDVHEELVDGAADAFLRPKGDKDELDTQQGDEDEGGSHRLHVRGGLGGVRLLQLGDQDADDVQEEEEVHLSCGRS